MPKVPSDRFSKARPVAPAAELVSDGVEIQSLTTVVEGAPQPTWDQYVARGRLWHAARIDPTLDLKTMSVATAASICREQRVVSWCKNLEWFRGWLMEPHVHEEQLEALLSRFVDGLNFRCATMADKDYLNAIKVLSEMADRMPKRWVKEKVLDAGVANKTDEQLQQMVLEAAAAMGYKLVRDDGPDTEK